MDFDSIGTGLIFLFDNYSKDKEVGEFIKNIDCAENDKDIKENVNKIIEILDHRIPVDKNVNVIKQLFKNFI